MALALAREVGWWSGGIEGASTSSSTRRRVATLASYRGGHSAPTRAITSQHQLRYRGGLVGELQQLLKAERREPVGHLLRDRRAPRRGRRRTARRGSAPVSRRRARVSCRIPAGRRPSPRTGGRGPRGRCGRGELQATAVADEQLDDPSRGASTSRSAARRRSRARASARRRRRRSGSGGRQRRRGRAPTRPAMPGEVLVETASTFGERHAERLVLRLVPAGRRQHHEPALAEQVERGQRLRERQRVAQRRDHGGGEQAQGRGARRDRGEQELRVGPRHRRVLVAGHAYSRGLAIRPAASAPRPSTTCSESITASKPASSASTARSTSVRRSRGEVIVQHSLRTSTMRGAGLTRWPPAAPPRPRGSRVRRAACCR